MNKKLFATYCLLALNTSFAFAYDNVSPVTTTCPTVLTKQDPDAILAFSKRVKENEQNIGRPIPRSIIFTPEVTMQDNTICFVTPCNGYEFRLLKNDIICYSTEIDSDTLTIPDTIHGTCELQIVTEDYIFYTTVTLP